MAKSKNSVAPAASEPEGFSLFLLYVRFSLEVVGLLLYTLYNFLLYVYRFFVPMEPKSLKNEIVLVTGGGNGIGREICLQLAKLEQTVTLILWDVDEAGNESTVKELKALGVRKVFAFKVDVSKREEVEATAQKIRSEIGNVTILFNNAGIGGPVGNGWEMSPVAVQKVFDINMVSHCWTLREFLPSMIANGRGGHVVETCSVFGFFYSKHASAYVGSKHAVKGYIESVKEDIRHLPGKPNVHFSLVYPHHTVTNMTKAINLRAGRYPFMMPKMTPAFVASKIIEGVRRNQEHIYVPGDMRLVAMLLPLLPPQVVRRLQDIVDVQGDVTD